MQIIDAGAQPQRDEKSPTELKHLTQEDLARRLRISPRSLERWRWLGRGPRFLKLNGRVCYRLEDVEAWERASERFSTPRRQRHVTP